jgi:hypothetical protein
MFKYNKNHTMSEPIHQGTDTLINMNSDPSSRVR